MAYFTPTATKMINSTDIWSEVIEIDGNSQ